jgi:hypothetical protein
MPFIYYAMDPLHHPVSEWHSIILCLNGSDIYLNLYPTNAPDPFNPPSYERTNLPAM